MCNSSFVENVTHLYSTIVCSIVNLKKNAKENYEMHIPVSLYQQILAFLDVLLLNLYYLDERKRKYY